MPPFDMAMNLLKLLEKSVRILIEHSNGKIMDNDDDGKKMMDNLNSCSNYHGEISEIPFLQSNM